MGQFGGKREREREREKSKNMREKERSGANVLCDELPRYKALAKEFYYQSNRFNVDVASTKSFCVFLLR